MNSYETENRFLVVWDCNGLESIFDINKELKAQEDWKKQKLFDNSPQIIVDWIRENGNKIYSDYAGADQKVIT